MLTLRLTSGLWMSIRKVRDVIKVALLILQAIAFALVAYSALCHPSFATVIGLIIFAVCFFAQLVAWIIAATAWHSASQGWQLTAQQSFRYLQELNDDLHKRSV